MRRTSCFGLPSTSRVIGVGGQNNKLSFGLNMGYVAKLAIRHRALYSTTVNKECPEYIDSVINGFLSTSKVPESENSNETWDQTHDSKYYYYTRYPSGRIYKKHHLNSVIVYEDEDVYSNKNISHGKIKEIHWKISNVQVQVLRLIDNGCTLETDIYVKLLGGFRWAAMSSTKC